jgi:hypothetical protein
MPRMTGAPRRHALPDDTASKLRANINQDRNPGIDEGASVEQKGLPAERFVGDAENDDEGDMSKVKSYDLGGAVDDTGSDTGSDRSVQDDSSSAALDTGADMTTPRIEKALEAVNEAMMYGREKFGLPRGDEGQGAIPDQTAANMPTRPAGPGGDRPDQNPFPTRTPAIPFGRQSANMPTRPAGPGGDQPDTNPFPTREPFGRRAQLDQQDEQAFAGGGIVGSEPMSSGSGFSWGGAGGGLPSNSSSTPALPMGGGTTPMQQNSAQPIMRAPTRPMMNRPGPTQQQPSFNRGWNAFDTYRQSAGYWGGRGGTNGQGYRGMGFARGGPVRLEDGGPPDDAPEDNTTPAIPTDTQPDDSMTTGSVPGESTQQESNMPPRSSIMDWLSGKEAATPEYRKEVESQITDKYEDTLSEAEKNVLAIQDANSLQNRLALIQSQRNTANDALHQARKISSATVEGEDLKDADGNKVATLLEKALSNVPTGEVPKVTYLKDGLYQFEVTPPGGGKPKVTVLTADQVHDLQNIGKAGQWDGIYERKIQGTLDALRQSPGTPLPKKEKPDTEKTNSGTYADRYPLSLQKAGAARFPWVSQQGQKIDWMEKQLGEQAERTSKETQAESRTEGLEKRAHIAAGSRETVSREATNRALLVQQHKDANALAALNQRDLNEQERNDIAVQRNLTSQGLPVTPQLQENINNMLSRHGQGASQQQAQTEQGQEPGPGASTAAPAGGQAQPAPQRNTQPAPSRGLNAQGSAAYGRLPPAGMVPDPRRSRQQ